MKKENCWEVIKCGREVGGDNVAELGVCPAATQNKFNGINGGENGGRACWMIAGTYCGGRVQGTYAQKKGTCLMCSFFTKVRIEETPDWVAFVDKKYG